MYKLPLLSLSLYHPATLFLSKMYLPMPTQFVLVQSFVSLLKEIWEYKNLQENENGSTTKKNQVKEDEPQSNGE